jgi:hypothetical protein
MENLKLLLRRRWYWFLLYALCYSGITTLVIYRFPMVPLLPLLVAFLPLLLIPVIYFGTLLWLHFRRHSLNRKLAQRLTECTGIALLTTIVTILPAIILSLANAQAHIGEILGDPLGLPSYMLVMTLLVLFLSGAIQAATTILSYQPAKQTYKEQLEKKQRTA